MRENEKLKGVPFIEAIVHGLQALQEARAPTTMYYMECNHNVSSYLRGTIPLKPFPANRGLPLK